MPARRPGQQQKHPSDLEREIKDKKQDMYGRGNKGLRGNGAIVRWGRMEVKAGLI
jgi:hypothetical protein